MKGIIKITMVIGCLAVGMILPTLMSVQTSNNQGIRNHTPDAVVTLPAKQSHFFVTTDYKRALRCLEKGYVLQDAQVFNDGSRTVYYTMVKYAK